MALLLLLHPHDTQINSCPLLLFVQLVHITCTKLLCWSGDMTGNVITIWSNVLERKIAMGFTTQYFLQMYLKYSFHMVGEVAINYQGGRNNLIYTQHGLWWEDRCRLKYNDHWQNKNEELWSSIVLSPEYLRI